MNPITLAVVSDMHVGRSARSRDLCPYDDGEGLDDDYVRHFIDFVRSEQIEADYLVVPGDASHTAAPVEFERASAAVLSIATQMGVNEDRILFVPGNHDVDWNVLNDPDPTGFRKKQRYGPLAEDSWVFGRILQDSNGNLLDHPNFAIWESSDLVVVGYNSSSHDDPHQAIHRGAIAQSDIEELQKTLNALSLAPECLRLFVVHHHPINYSDPIPDDPDFSGMTNAENLLRLLQKYNFDLIVHGHKHSPRFSRHILDAGLPLAILCSGSFSLLLDTRWSGLVSNQFHLISVCGRDEHNQCIKGAVYSWAYIVGRHWIPSQQSNGIRHIEPFGTYIQPAALKAFVQPLVEEQLAAQNWASWDAIVTNAPDLEHLPTERILEVLDSVAADTHATRVGSPPDRIVLVREDSDG